MTTIPPDSLFYVNESLRKIENQIRASAREVKNNKALGFARERLLNEYKAFEQVIKKRRYAFRKNLDVDSSKKPFLNAYYLIVWQLGLEYEDVFMKVSRARPYLNMQKMQELTGDKKIPEAVRNDTVTDEEFENLMATFRAQEAKLEKYISLLEDLL
jgi:hypothetical protein